MKDFLILLVVKRGSVAMFLFGELPKFVVCLGFSLFSTCVCVSFGCELALSQLH